MSTSHWTCPVCQQPLKQRDRQYSCPEGHSFDQAREGYVNLLLASQKRSADPGDARAMLRSRREFLERGYYAPLADELAGRCREYRVSHPEAPFALLDLGCGEGYYTARIASALQDCHASAGVWVGGIDIARDGIRMAAKRYRAIDFAVASTARLPVADASMDALVSIFAPSQDVEIRRVLKPGGCFLRVSPGPRHLFELRALIYAAPREHAPAETEIAGLTHVQRRRLGFDLAVSGVGDVARLLAMTPYYWQATPEQQAQICELESLATKADFTVDLFRA